MIRPSSSVHQEHPARLQAALCDDARSGGISSTPTSEAMTTRPSRGDVVARGPQAVAVEHGADTPSVKAMDAGRPRLHQAGVVLVEGRLSSVIDSWSAPGSGIIIIMACGRDRPDRTRSPGTLSNIAESEPSGSMTGRSFLRSSPKSVGFEQRLAGVHPVDVAAQGVDLAVVGDVAVGVGASQEGKVLVREARVDQRQRALEGGVAQVGVELGPAAR